MIKKFIISEQDKNLRLDIFLMKNLNISRNKCSLLIDSEQVFVNDELKKKRYLLKTNDIIITSIVEKESEINIFKPVDLNLKIIYEDQYLAVIDKPVNLIVHPSNSYSGTTLINGLYHQIKDFQCQDTARPGIVHRLDKDTTGLIIVGKTDEFVKIMQKLIQKRKVQRIYWALIHGYLGYDYGTIDLPIKRSVVNFSKMEVSDKGKTATTHFKILKKFKDFSLLELKLDTGRTHQIRVHLSYLKHPIVGDVLYGNKNQSIQQQLLHSKKINFTHPITNQYVELETPLPSHFQEFLVQIEN
ncbi:RluA family pseudouridine synthase ['Camptotheca acuminata' phytoplasma]|uniref:RluA family pseudouridine synthase n=1 Tax='Camptotheca acuminata' phytoplasma TaxID=3239192 RepID=UPI00351A5FF3